MRLRNWTNNSLLEGMASGLAVVSTDLQGIRDYASEKGCVLVEKGDVDTLTDVAHTGRSPSSRHSAALQRLFPQASKQNSSLKPVDNNDNIERI